MCVHTQCLYSTLHKVKWQVLPAGNRLCIEFHGHSSSPGPATGGLACAGDAAGSCRAMDLGQELCGAPRR